MSGNEDMTDVGIASLTLGCSQIRVILIAYCSQLTDASLAAIGETCKGLTSFDMRSNRSMTHAGIASLRQKCSQIVRIHNKGC